MILVCSPSHFKTKYIKPRMQRFLVQSHKQEGAFMYTSPHIQYHDSRGMVTISATSWVWNTGMDKPEYT